MMIHSMLKDAFAIHLDLLGSHLLRKKIGLDDSPYQVCPSSFPTFPGGGREKAWRDLFVDRIPVQEGLSFEVGAVENNADSPPATARVPTDLTILYFSASWCGYCNELGPKLIRMYQQARLLGKSVKMVFVPIPGGRSEGEAAEREWRDAFQ